MITGDPRKIVTVNDLAGAAVWAFAAAKAFWFAEPGSQAETDAYDALRDRLELLLRVAS